MSIAEPGHREEGIRAKLDCALATLINVFTVMILLMATGINAIAPLPTMLPWMRVMWWVAFLGVIVADGWLLWTTCYGMSKQYLPLGAYVASQHPRLPWVLRPWASVWWAGHGLLITGWGLIISIAAGSRHWWGGILALPLVWGFNYLAYTYVALVVAAICRQGNVLAAVWRWRSLFALVLSFLTGAGALLVRHYLVKI